MGLEQRLAASEARITALENAILQQLELPTHRRAEFQPETSEGFELEVHRENLGDRVAKLEAEWEKLGASTNDQDDPSGKKPSLKINGRVHLDYWNFTDDSPGIGFFEDPVSGTDPEDRIFFRRIRLNFQGDLYGNMLYRMQIDFNSPDSGEMKDMYIGFKALPMLGTVLFGNRKRPLGLDHLNSSRFNVFIERPLVVEAFNEDARRVGVVSYNVTDDESYHWRYGVFVLENMVRDGDVIGDSMQVSGNVRLASSPWYDDATDGRDYFHWAASGMVAKPDGDVFPGDTNANEARFRTRSELRSDRRWLDTGRIAEADAFEMLGLEAILNLGPLQVVGEYQLNWLQRDDVATGASPNLSFQGGYVYIAYMLTGEHVPYDRGSGTIGRVRPFEDFFLLNSCEEGAKSGWGAWQLALRYSYLDLSDEDVFGGVGNNLTLGLVWYFNPHSSLQLNAIYGDVEEHALVGGFDSGHFTALGARMRLNF